MATAGTAFYGRIGLVQNPNEFQGDSFNRVSNTNTRREKSHNKRKRKTITGDISNTNQLLKLIGFLHTTLLSTCQLQRNQ